MLTLLRTQSNFRRFWLGQVVSQVGDRVYSLALLWIVYQWTGSGLAVGVVMIAATLPGVLVGPLAGEYADRWNRRLVLVWADLVRAALVFWLAWRAHADLLSLPELLVATALLSVAAAFFNPTALAMLPNLVPPGELTRANAMNQLSANASGVLGPLLGSGLIALIGVPLAFAANAGSYLWSAACEATIRVPPAGQRAARGVWEDLREGWRAAAAQPLVTRLLGPIVVTNFFFTAVVVLVPVLAEGVYRTGAAGLGLMMSSYALGMLAGAAAVSAIRLRRGLWVWSGMVGMGVAFLAMGILLWLPLTLAGLAAVGLALNVSNISLITIYQQLIPDELRGKVFGLLVALSLSLQPIAYGVMGGLIELFSPQAILLASGLVIIASGLTLVRVPELRAL